MSDLRLLMLRSPGVWGLLLTFIGCGGPTPVCAPGRAVPCACADGRNGAQTCSAAGTYSECRCISGISDAGRDSGASLLTDAITFEDRGGSDDSSIFISDSASQDVTRSDTLPLDIGGPIPVDAGGTTPVDAGISVQMDVQLTDVQSPPDAGSPSPSCSNLPSTTMTPTRMTFGLSGDRSTAGNAIGFSAGGLFGALTATVTSRYVTVYNFEGFSRTFTAGTPSSIPVVRFIGENLVLTQHNGRLLIGDESRGVALLDASLGVAVDREQGIFYSNAGRLFRWTIGTPLPGNLVVSGVDGPISMVLNSDASALYYLTSGSTGGIYYVGLRRDSGGVFTGDTPSLYLSSSVLGTPAGLAIDVCGNLYTADTRGNFLWRIPAGANPGQPGTRLIVLASAYVGRPEFGHGRFGSSNLFMANTGYYIPAGVEGVRQ